MIEMSARDTRDHHVDLELGQEVSGRGRAPHKPSPGQGITRDQYTVGWVCALPLEMAAAKGMLDKIHPDLTEQDPNDHNTYLLGEIFGHKVVIACLPAGVYGIVPAAKVATHMLRTFKSIRFGLLVGIGGGIPSKIHDIRLGDIVVSQPKGLNGGVFQYDRGRLLEVQGFERTGMLNAPPQSCFRVSRGLPQKMKKRFGNPGASNDHLYLAQYPHIKDNPTCEQCDHSQTYKREAREGTAPVIHYGTIASGNQVIKDATLRDQIGNDLGALCCEMEAAGLQDFPSLVIRGICDYADSHKNNMWQCYAAAVAAAFAKELLSVIPPSRVLQEDPIPQLVSIASEHLDVMKQHVELSSRQLDEHRRTNQIMEGRPISLHIIDEARYDSADVGSSPRCEKNTRVRILQSIEQWATAADAEPFLWIVGPAGTGKSTLIRSVADSLHKAKRLVAGYFFKRGEQGRNDTSRLFSTLAMQLVDTVPCFKGALRISLGDIDKDSIDKKDIRFQFEKLLKDPLETLSPLDLNQENKILVLDALDECECPENLPRILGLISEICTSPKRPLGFRVLLSSRPDPRVMSSLESLVKDGVAQKLQLHKVFSEDTRDDIRLYLETNFKKIKAAANIQQHLWPALDEVDHLVKLSTHPEPLFIYAATLIRFVYDERHLQNPKNQLKLWLMQCENNKSQLDQMYNPILEQIFDLAKDTDTDFDQQLLFLGSLVLVAKPLSLPSLTALLGLDVDDVSWWLPSLHAVLDIPSNLNKPIRLLHKSFADFLLSENNPNHDHFRLDSREVHSVLADRCMRLMERLLKRDICDLGKLDIAPAEIDHKVIEHFIPFELQYSCLYWVYHLQANGCAIFDRIIEFLTKYFLHWLEVLALLKQTSTGLEAICSLAEIVQRSPNISTKLVDFLKDAIRTVSSFASIIEGAPLQTYASLILFSPTASLVRQTFWDQRLPSLSHIEGVKCTWDAHVQTLQGESLVQAVALSPDGRLLALADSAVRLRNAPTGTPLMSFEADSRPLSVIFSPNSQLLAASYRYGIIRIWDVPTRAQLQTIQSFHEPVSTIKFSPDNELLGLSATIGGTVQFWNVRSGALKKEINVTSSYGQRFEIAISPDLQLAAAWCSFVKSIELWDLETETVHHVFHTDGTPRCVGFSQSGKHVAASLTVRKEGVRVNENTYRFDSTPIREFVSVWNTTTYELEHTTKDLPVGYCVALSPQEQLLLSIPGSKTLTIWNMTTGIYHQLDLGGIVVGAAFATDVLAIVLKGARIKLWDLTYADLGRHQARVGNRKFSCQDIIVFSPNGKLAGTVTEPKTLRIWDTSLGKSLHKVTFKHDIHHFQFSPDSRLVGTAAIIGEPAFTIDVASGTSSLMLNHKRKYLGCPVAYSESGQLAAVFCDERAIQLHDTVRGNHISTLRGHSGKVSELALSPDGKFLAASFDETIRVWNTKTGGLQCSMTYGRRRKLFKSRLIFSPRGEVLIAQTNNLTWWDIGTGILQHTLRPGSYEGIRASAFSPNLKLLGLQYFDKSTKLETFDLYNGKTAQHLHTFYARMGRACQIAFSQDSLMVVVASQDRTIRLWDTMSYLELHTLQICNDEPAMIRLSDSGAILAAASKDRSIRLWDTRNGRLMQFFRQNKGVIQNINFTHNQLVVSVSDVESERLWDPWNTHTFQLSNYSYPLLDNAVLSIEGLLASEVNLDAGECWIMKGFEKTVLIPPEYRPAKAWEDRATWAKRGPVLFIISSSGRFILFRGS